MGVFYSHVPGRQSSGNFPIKIQIIIIIIFPLVINRMLLVSGSREPDSLDASWAYYRLFGSFPELLGEHGG